MFCRYCGTAISDDAVFCQKCGKQQEQAPAQGTVRRDEKPSNAVTDVRPKKRRMSPLLGIVLLAILLVAGGIGVFLHSSQPQAPVPAAGGIALAYTTAQQFCDLLVRNDYPSAYAMLVPGDFSSLSDFESKVGNALNNGQHTLTNCSVNPNPQQNDNQDQSMDFGGAFNFSDGTEKAFTMGALWNQNAHRYDIDAWLNGNFILP